MRKIEFFIIITFTLFLSGCVHAQSTVSEKQAIEMLKEFYTAHNNVWLFRPPLASDVLERKLDSLNAIYCTSKLRVEAKKALKGDYGRDIITNDFPGINSFENFKVEKDLAIKNGYIVTYTTFNDLVPNVSKKEIKVVIRVTVKEEGGALKIDNVE